MVCTQKTTIAGGGTHHITIETGNICLCVTRPHFYLYSDVYLPNENRLYRILVSLFRYGILP